MVTCLTEVNRARFLAANLFLYLCPNLVYEGKGNGGKSEEVAILFPWVVNIGGKYSMKCWKQDTIETNKQWEGV